MGAEKDISYGEYWTEIASLAKEVPEQAREEDADVYDRLHEFLDSHQWVIYYAYHFDVLKHTQNEDAIFEAGFDLSGIESLGALTTPATFYAMMQDVLEHSDWEG